MKKIFASLTFLFFIAAAVAQKESSGTFNRAIVKDSIFLNGKWYKTLQVPVRAPLNVDALGILNCDGCGGAGGGGYIIISDSTITIDSISIPGAKILKVTRIQLDRLIHQGIDTSSHLANNALLFYDTSLRIWRSRIINYGDCIEGISGDSSVCRGGGTKPMTSLGHSGGIWLSSNPGISTVNASTGLVTGVNVGVDTIYYRITNDCGSYLIAHRMRTDTLPSAGSVTISPASLQVGKVSVATSTGSNGVGTPAWSSSDITKVFVTPTATPTSAYVVGIAAGFPQAIYSLTNGCGTSTAGSFISISAATTGTLTPSNFVYNETPSGSVNSSNVTFTIANTPVAGTVEVWLSGVKQLPTTHYTVSGTTITFVTAPTTGTDIRVNYQK